MKSHSLQQYIVGVYVYVYIRLYTGIPTLFQAYFRKYTDLVFSYVNSSLKSSIMDTKYIFYILY